METAYLDTLKKWGIAFENAPDQLRRSVYFIGAINRTSGEIDMLKIGISKPQHVHLRVSTFQTGCPDELVLIGQIRNCHCRFEKQLHHRFEDAHVRGEWFRMNDEIKEFLIASFGQWSPRTKGMSGGKANEDSSA